MAVMAAAAYLGGCMIVDANRKDMTMACLASVHGALLKLDSEAFAAISVDTKEWRAVSTPDADRLVALAATTRALDCRVEPRQPLMDYWGNRITIAAREVPNGELEFRVSSDGADGRAGTQDDLVSEIAGR